MSDQKPGLLQRIIEGIGRFIGKLLGNKKDKG